MAAALGLPVANASAPVPPSNRVTINLGETPWRYLKDRQVDSLAPTLTTYDDSPANTADVWSDVGVPQSPSDNDTFLNLPSGGGEGQLTGAHNWYRKHFKLDQAYSNRKVFVEFEGANQGTQVYINGQLLPTNSLVNPNATHVQGFVPFIVDLTPYVKFGGVDNVLAVQVARGDTFYVSPAFSGSFRFGQSDSGLYRPVWMYLEDRVHIPQNTWATLNTWGTYVSTLSASDEQAVVRVQTNVRNEYPDARTVTLLTQIYDQNGQLVQGASAQSAPTSLPSNPLPTTPAKIAPETASPPPTFDQTITVPSPHLWYPNNSEFGKPYMYTVVSTVSINGVVVDSTTTPLGIRTITWDSNFPIINGHPHHLWGGSGRYDYPALGAAVPEEIKWRDLQLLADAGGSLWRPGHSSEGPAFLRAADNLGIMVIQPSGDGENGFGSICPEQTGNNRVNCNENGTDMELKKELHRDMIIHDRNNPSVLAWEANNGTMDTPFAQLLKSISLTWDPVQPRVQADRTDVAANGDIHSCSGDGCDVGLKTGTNVNNMPVYGAEYWGDGVQRSLYDYEILFATNPVKNWSQGLNDNVFGIAHWYLADTPGEITTQVDGPDKSKSPFGLPLGVQPQFGSTPGSAPFMIRGNMASMTDHNRFPRLLYYIYQAAWTSFDTKPVVHLGYHWNRAGNVTVNAFSNCPAVRLLINGTPQGSDQVPNPQNQLVGDDVGPNSVSLPRQVHWNVAWASGTVAAECLDTSGRVVSLNGAPVVDTQFTAGVPDHVELSVAPEIVRPDGSQFQIEANGTDAALVTARVVDAAGHLVPTFNQIATFGVSTPATGVYRGGADSYVSFPVGVTPTDDVTDPNTKQVISVYNGLPQGYHAPGDVHLSFEGGLAKFAVRSTFVPGNVTVTADVPGLRGATQSFTTVAVSGPSSVNGVLVVPGQSASALAVAQQPASVTIAERQTATFTVLSAGSGTLTYQWLKNGVNIAGANSFTFTTPQAALGDSGSNYRVIVSNGTTTVESDPAILTVVPLAVPTITAQPQPQTVVAGQSAEFSVTAAGSPTLAYQWFKNGTPIAGANGAVYDTPPAATGDDGALFSVVVSNSAGNSPPSTGARLTVAAAIAPAIVAQPLSRSVFEGQSVSFSVTASGSNPLNYQWLKDGQPIAGSANSSTLTIPVVSVDDAGGYQVRVSNAASSGALSDVATLQVSGSSGPNLALGKVTGESSEEGANDNSKFAVDGDSKVSRWASAQKIDDSWMGVDLGAPTTFDRVGIVWENAFAATYRLETSNQGVNDPNAVWTEVIPNGASTSTIVGTKAGPVSITFPSTTARSVRMHGITRGSDYGYSMYEFQVYDVPQCGGSTERYTLLPAQAGTYHSTIPKLPDGPFVPNVVDNISHLTWQQTTTTFPDQGDQFTQIVADQYCKSVGMRLPTLAEAQGIAANNFAACAFHNPWTIWTSTNDPDNAGRAWFLDSTGTTSSQKIDNAPGWAMCVSGTGTGTGTGAPVVTSGLTNQTAAVGATATFTAVVSGTGPLTFQWFKNGTQVGTTTVASFTTAALTASDNGAVFTATATNAGGTVNIPGATLTVTGGTSAPVVTGGLANQTAAVGATATFTATVTGTGPLTFKWFENGTQVGTTTVASFTTATLTANDNGAVFTATVTNAGGTANIPGATLTVTGGTGSNPPPSTGANLALHQTATAKNVQDAGYSPSAVTDGDLNSRWSSAQDDTSWITVDLGTAQAFDRVVLRWEAAFGLKYTIVTSNDGVNWSQPVHTENAGKGGVEDFAVTPTTARYVRMQGVLRGTPYGYSLYEFEVYNTAKTPSFAITASSGANGTIAPAGTVNALQGASKAFTFTPAAGFAVTGVLVDGQSQGLVSSYTFANLQASHTIAASFSPASAAVDLALHKTTFQSGEQDNNDNLSSAMAVDGNLNSRWSSNFDDGAWMTVDLGSVVPFDRVIFHWQDAHATAYKIQVSNNNTDWATAPVVYSTGASRGGTEDIAFAEVRARYIRLQGVTRSSGYGYSLFGFEVYDMPATP